MMPPQVLYGNVRHLLGREAVREHDRLDAASQQEASNARGGARHWTWGSVPASVGDGHEGPNLRFEIKLAAQFARDLFGLMLIFSD
jgi:hypothetical protein